MAKKKRTINVRRADPNLEFLERLARAIPCEEPDRSTRVREVKPK